MATLNKGTLAGAEVILYEAQEFATAVAITYLSLFNGGSSSVTVTVSFSEHSLDRRTVQDLRQFELASGESAWMVPSSEPLPSLYGLDRLLISSTAAGSVDFVLQGEVS